ncbi:MAG: hypothetical protein PQJ60_13420 [Spirochaetales bacterium]|nr:hypothetical protein [Spirochaetales bacterium]
MEFSPKPLGHVKQGLAELGQDVSYVYDDLIFPENTAYLIQFGKENYELNIYLNKECSEETAQSLTEDLTRVFAGSIGFSLNYPGRFTLNEKEGSEEMEIVFEDHTRSAS